LVHFSPTQINFHSENACGSFIIAASEAYLEGRRHGAIYKQKQEEHIWDLAQELQKQMEETLLPNGNVCSHWSGTQLFHAKLSHFFAASTAPQSRINRKSKRRRTVYLEKSDRRLRIDDVRAFVVPLDVDISQEVPWLTVCEALLMRGRRFA